MDDGPRQKTKPLDGAAFITLVKTASEFVRRSEQQMHAQLNPSVSVICLDGRVTVCLCIVPDEDSPYITLSAQGTVQRCTSKGWSSKARLSTGV